MSADRPRLRPYVEPVPVRLPEEAGGAEVFLLKDPFRLAGDRQLVLPPAGLALAALLDGSRTAAEAAEELAARHGARVPLAQVAELVAALEEALLLDGPRFAAAVADFARADVREAACVGSYPGDPAELRAFLAAQYVREGGPGAGPADGGDDGARGSPIRGIVSPHIDMRRGGHAYAWTWRAVAEACPADLFVVFGTSHTGTAPLDGGSSPRFALTRKAFRTPLGDVPTDVVVVDRLLERYAGPDDLLAGEFHHRGEHSIEFQAVYLSWLFGGRRDVRILPVLCGGLSDLPGDPSGDPSLTAFHDALAAALADVAPERVAFVAAIDLAHVGSQFHQPPLDEAGLARIEAQDRRTLEVALDERCPDALHRDIVADGDARGVCGHAPLVALLQALRRDPVAGELLRYDRWYDGESTVSFASAVFRRA